MSLPTPFSTPYNSSLSTDPEIGNVEAASGVFDQEVVPLSPGRPPPASGQSLRSAAGGRKERPFRDVIWAVLFLGHLGLIGWALVLWGKERFHGGDKSARTTTYWAQYAGATGFGVVLAWAWLLLYGRFSADMIKMSVHSMSTFGAVLSVLLFWNHSPLWGIGFGAASVFAFLFSLAIIDRVPFTSLVIQKAVGLVGDAPSTPYCALIVGAVSVTWLGLWTFGASGVMGLQSVQHRWAKLLLLALSLSWTATVACNVVHVAAAASFAKWFLAGGSGGAAKSSGLLNALTRSFGSICLGSLFSPPVRLLRWLARGFRSRMGANECMLCCLDCYLGLLEGLIRIFNKYAYVHIGVDGKGFNRASTDAWERFQLTGVEALVARDLSGAVLLLSILLGGLIVGTFLGTWVHYTEADRMVPMAVTGGLIGMMLIGLTTAITDAAVTTIYVMFAEDPVLISRWDSEFAVDLEAVLNERLAHRARKPFMDAGKRQPQ